MATSDPQAKCLPGLDERGMVLALVSLKAQEGVGVGDLIDLLIRYFEIKGRERPYHFPPVAGD
jgi:hypothetical protein